MKLTSAERAIFRRMGKKGAAARAKKLSPERRSEIAKIARAAQLKMKEAMLESA